MTAIEGPASSSGSGTHQTASYPLRPTTSSLLELCNLPSTSTDDDRHRRLATLQTWARSHPTDLGHVLTSPDCRDRKSGCMALHWAAGTGFNEAIGFLLDNLIGNMARNENSSTSLDQAHDDSSSSTSSVNLSVDQKAHHPSTDRTPLHYAARNGHLSTCRLLIEQCGANPHPKCGRGGVTPLQLAVWQNQLKVVQYLVERNALVGNTDVVFERNGFNCGLMHWLGLVPKKRWGAADGDAESVNNDADGSGVLPLARYLHSLGVTYESTPPNSNTQGHTPMHKAAWGGNLPLIQYFRDEHGVYDCLQDQAGNYCADIATMRGNNDVHKWLLEHGSLDRHESYRILGLDDGASEEEVRRRYRELARKRHPDKQHRMEDDGKDEGDGDAFIRIKEAYEHLTKEGGVGKQKNPKYAAAKLIEAQRHFGEDESDANAQDDLFLARLAAVLSDYGDDGFPVSLIARRWNQIWPDRPFPTPDEYIIERKTNCGDDEGVKIVRKKTKLLKFLRWKCRDTQINFRAVKGEVLAFDMTLSSTCTCNA